MRKVTTILLALAIVLSMAVPALASETTYSITINNSTEGHTYEAYQIFAGDLHEGILSNIVWGSDVTVAGQTALGDASAKAAALTEDNAQAFAKEVSAYLDGEPTASVSTVTDGKYVISGLTAGYYLIKDKDESLNGKNDSYTEYILKVVEDVTATPKADVPKVEKKVKDTNDSVADSTTNWQDSADHDIGDAVPFQLTATLANNVSAYTTYKVVFHDTLSAGLTYNNDAVVYFGETDVTSYFSIAEENGTLTISCDDVKAFGATDSSVITVEYTAILNENAVLGSTGNPNEVYLEYSNNPNKSEEGNDETGNTPEDVVIVFTYKVIVNKVDQDKNALAGAGFTLYKWEEVTIADDPETEEVESGTKYDWVAVGEEVTGAEMTTFEWKGLDDGNYKLVETTTPAGYNTISPIEFTITAEHEVLSDNPALTSLNGGDLFTGEVSTGTLSTEVVNQIGTTLPETGGAGTTMFYIFGTILVLGAAVLLVTKKRMAN